MNINVRNKKQDQNLKLIVEALKKYSSKHPEAEIDVYRYDNVSVRIRIVNPEFARMKKAERDTEVWPLLQALPDEAFADISLLLLFAPEETESSFANREFDNPLPARI